MDFLLGTAIIVLPAQHQVPLALATAAFKGLQSLRQRSKMKRAASTAANLPAAASNEVALEWRDLTCTLNDKKAGWVGRGVHAACIESRVCVHLLVPASTVNHAAACRSTWPGAERSGCCSMASRAARRLAASPP